MNKEDKIKLIIKKDSFYVNKSGNVIGVIYFEANNYLFPEYNWDDFVVVLLFWLTNGIVELIFNKKKEVEMDFMEGSFKISLKLNAQNKCMVNFIEGEKLEGDEEIIHKTITIPFDVMKSEVIDACEKILQIRDPQKMNFNEDYKNLEKSYNLLIKT